MNAEEVQGKLKVRERDIIRLATWDEVEKVISFAFDAAYYENGIDYIELSSGITVVMEGYSFFPKM
jgi:hypothetical protein